MLATIVYASDPQELLDVDDFLHQLANRPAWMADAACREHPEMTWFPTRGQSVETIRSVCDGCLVREECASYSLSHSTHDGMWGGLSERQRRPLRRLLHSAA